MGYQTGTFHVMITMFGIKILFKIYVNEVDARLEKNNKNTIKTEG